MVSKFARICLLLFLCSIHLISADKPLPSKEDCISLWSVVAGAGGDLRNVATKNSAAMGGVLKLYEDCLRSEEGIRYRRNYYSKSIGDSKREYDLWKLLQKLD